MRREVADVEGRENVSGKMRRWKEGFSKHQSGTNASRLIIGATLTAPDLTRYENRNRALTVALDLCAKDAIVDFGKGGVLVPDEPMERASGALEQEQTFQSSTEVLEKRFLLRTILLDAYIDRAFLVSIAHKAMRVLLALLESDSRPTVLDQLDLGTADVLVGLDEVGCGVHSK